MNLLKWPDLKMSPPLLSVRYSCAVVLVFWLWREIVLKMRTSSFYKKILLGYFFTIR